MAGKEGPFYHPDGCARVRSSSGLVSPACTVVVRSVPFSPRLSAAGRENSIGRRLSRLSVLFSSRKKSPVYPPNRGDSRLATHPSDHNAVYVRNVTQREQRCYKPRRGKGQTLKKLKKSELDYETLRHNQQHSFAFLVPVPLFYGYGCPSVVPCGLDGRCAAVSVCLSNKAFRS